MRKFIANRRDRNHRHFANSKITAAKRNIYHRRLLCEPLEQRALLSLTPQLVADINAVGFGSDPNQFCQVGSVVYFVATTPETGTELWKSDGTAAGTALVKDIRSGGTGSGVKYFTALGGVLFFAANDGTSGSELWKSDGTAAGTALVKDIYSGTTSSSPKYLTAM